MKKLVLLLAFLPCLTSLGQGYKVYKSDGKVDAYPEETVNAVTLNDDSLRYEGHEYVDLGLPSGTRWATANVGAEKDYQNGLHFSFQRAETDGQWGGDWRLPGITEYQELLKVCQWEWTKVVNSQGYLVTGPNGNKMFLPAAGHIDTNGSFVGGLSGQIAGYWTNEGYSFAFSPQTKGLAANNPAMQLSLRPVIGGKAMPDVRSEVVKEDSHDYVDLGLSVLWAATNIGAAMPEDYGNYFGPCMTAPMPTDYPSLTYVEQEDWYQSHCPYYVNNYPIANYYLEYARERISEEDASKWDMQYLMNQRLNLGEMDYWIIPEHDAATVLWGDGWRMPTLSEYKELLEKTTRTNSSYYVVFTGPNGNKLTIPKAGCFSIYDGRNNNYGYYLTSSIVEYPYLVDITQRTFQYYDYYANQYFCPIRPVKDRPKTGLTDEKTASQQEMVNLGLGVLWSSCNWGAANETDKGEYAAWGETFPKATYTGTNYSMAGYSAQSTQNMFGRVGWTLPTAADVQELIEKCTWAREDKGYRVTGPNGNSIFLPYTGFREGSSLSYPDELGFYWTADTLQALRIDNTGTPSVKEATGYFGMSVRPIMNPAIPETGDVIMPEDWIWSSVFVNIKVRGDFRDVGIQYSYFKYMDNPLINSWREPAYATNENDNYQVTCPPVQPNTTYYYRAFVNKEDGTTLYGDTKEFHTTANIPAVDLGLSVKWAPVNLGATYEYDFKDWYFHPIEYNNQADKLPGTLSGSCGNSYVESTTWPDEWRMPTEAEFQELMDKCTWEWQEGDSINWTLNLNPENRNGYKVTGPNGNSIFLPANGSGNGSMTPVSTGTIGFYWTQTPSEKHAGCYNLLKFTATDKKISFGPTSGQYNIRPVKK